MLKDGENVHALRTLIRTTMAMFGVPLLVMAATYWLMPAAVVSDQNRMVCAGIAAICSVQLVIVGFLVHAFNEPTSMDANSADAVGGKESKKTK